MADRRAEKRIISLFHDGTWKAESTSAAGCPSVYAEGERLWLTFLPRPGGEAERRKRRAITISGAT